MEFDVVVIGAGQAGLVASKKLADKGVNYITLERGVVGNAWRQRPAELKLFTSRQFCGLPGLLFSGDPNGFPTCAEMAAYLECYWQALGLKIRSHCQVIQASKVAERFHLSLNNGDSLSCKVLINATGANQIVDIPHFSSKVGASVLQLDATAKLNHLPLNSRVVIVGDGASGRQIAKQLAMQHQVTLARGKKRRLTPNRLLGKDIFWWLNKIGILFSDKNSLIARLLQGANPVPCAAYNNPRLRQAGVTIVGRVIDAVASGLLLDDGQILGCDCVIWALGYRDDTQWLALPHCVTPTAFIENFGLTPEPGLFVVGRKWLSCRASELVMGAERDVDRVMLSVMECLQAQSVLPSSDLSSVPNH